MNITLFSSRTVKGKELASLLEEAIPGIVSSIGDIRSDMVRIKTIFPGDTEFAELFFHHYQRRSDLVIFDASVETEDGCPLGENYTCAPFATLMNERVLIVSRTVLPLNFVPYGDATNVLPIGEDYVKDGNALRPIRSYDNHRDILPWVEKRIRGLFVNGTLSARFSKVSKSRKASGERTPNILLQDGRKVAFISYRSFYNEPQKCGISSVQDLERIILSYHKDKDPEEQWRVLFYHPGSLSQDCPTEVLRWSLMARVENVFKYVDEVWIFDSRAEDGCSYWDSWFTQGEFLSLMQINQGLPDSMPEVFLFNPYDQSFSRLVDLPRLSESSKKELAIYSANSDSVWGDRITLKRIVWSKENGGSRPVQMKAAGLLSRLILRIAGLKEETDLNQMMTMHHAYSKSFLTSRVVSCPHCAQGGYGLDSFRDEAFIEDFMNIGSDSPSLVKHNQQRGVFLIKQEDLAVCVQRGYVVCPNCHNKIGIKRMPDQDYYLWQRFLPNYPFGNERIEKVEAFSVI